MDTPAVSSSNVYFSYSSRSIFNPFSGLTKIYNWAEKTPGLTKEHLQGCVSFLNKLLVDDPSPKTGGARNDLEAAVNQINHTNAVDTSTLMTYFGTIQSGEDVAGKSYKVGQYQIARALYTMFEAALHREAHTVAEETALRLAALFIDDSESFPAADCALAQALVAALDDTSEEKGAKLTAALTALRDQYYEPYGFSWAGRQTINRVTG